jgi:dihydrodipicolinate synthase/N-acetylneuraminate lyase
MSSFPKIQGVICPMTTPFKNDGQIDYPAVRQLVEFLVTHGVDWLMPAGTTGEGPLLSLEERKALAECVLQQSAGRTPVIVHTGCLATADTIELTRHAQAAGAMAASAITPYYYTFDDDALFNHFLSVARSVPGFPISMYSFPGNAKNAISLSLFQRLRGAVDNLVAIKLTDVDLVRFQEYVEAGGAGFSPLSGVDGLALAALSVGSVGQVTGNANAFPEFFRALFDAFSAGNMEEARRQQKMINRIRAILKDAPVYFKAALALRGIEGGRMRPPMRELTPDERLSMETGLHQLGVV